MGNTPRERLLMMLLPALVVVGGYMFAYNRDKELTAAQVGLEKARASAAQPFDVAESKAKVEETEDKLKVLKEEKLELDRRWKQLASQQELEPEKRIKSLRQLSAMLWARKLHSFEESVAEEVGGEIAPSFQSALAKLKGSEAPIEARRLWRVRFVGRYADVLEALESLRDSGSPIIPVSISMSSTRTDTLLRSWTLLLWI